MNITPRIGSVRRKAKGLDARLRQLGIRATDSGPTTSAGTARVAVVIPVFNAMPYLRELLESLAAQDLDPALFEVIAVDDGSTDGAAQVLQDFGAHHPNWRVIRQRNSGWPGQPRNVGIAASTSDYVFFADADDVLGSETLRRMVAFADEHQVDVLAPRMVGIGGRGIVPGVYTKTLVDAPLRTILATLSPQKMVRRELLDTHSIRFPEGLIRLEDGMMLTRCYLASRRNSILVDYDYYFIRTREDGGNISSRRSAPEEYTNSVATIARIIKDNLEDAGQTEVLVLDLYRRKVLRAYAPARFRAMNAHTRARTLAAHARFASEHIPEALEAHLGFPHLQRSRLVRSQDEAGLLRLARTEEDLNPACRAELLASPNAGLLFDLGQAVGYQAVRLLARARGADATMAFDLARSGAGHTLALPLAELSGLGPVLVDFYVQLRLDGIDGPALRVLAPARGLPRNLDGTRLYATVKGYLSLDQRG
ncbi:glycosyltransferase family 2 protein [Paeniglutamicibacter sp.]|uniref:glycosyltransferase family 2 protein n=1 Tax=Paeniglutamicibacter sp. TaxID=1934391 RepID=UPI00398A4961